MNVSIRDLRNHAARCSSLGPLVANDPAERSFGKGPG